MICKVFGNVFFGLPDLSIFWKYVFFGLPDLPIFWKYVFFEVPDFLL